MSSIWTPSRVERLIELFDDGLTCREIGRRMGITKNAVIGKLYRLGLSKDRIDPSITANPFPETGTCVWPYGDPGTEGFHFCGADIPVPGNSYCVAHSALAYLKIPKQRDLDIAA